MMPSSRPWWAPDARGWIGIGAFVLVVLIVMLLALVPGLRSDEFFKTIATLVVGGFVKDVLSWAYSATKGGGELADRNAEIVKRQAEASPPIAG